MEKSSEFELEKLVEELEDFSDCRFEEYYDIVEMVPGALEKLKSRGHNPALIFIGEACIKKNTLHYYLLRGSATLRK